jgi:hypothetical protein
VVPSVIEINLSVTREKSYLKTIWDYDNANYIAINQHLQNTDWDMEFGDSDNVSPRKTQLLIPESTTHLSNKLSI